MRYRNAVWNALLTAAGARSVTFTNANGGPAALHAPSAPTIPVPGPPLTPTGPPRKAMCKVPASYFVFNRARLIDAATAEQDLTPCISSALAAHATFALDGWASYEGPLSHGKPAVDYASNLRLSDERVQAVANLLVHRLGVPRSDITRMTGHGNENQPNPNPRSPANRVVLITYTIK